MRMQIELQGCSLEVAHIGTREEINVEMLMEWVHTAAGNLVDIGLAIAKVFAEAFIQIGQAFCQIGQNLLVGGI